MEFTREDIVHAIDQIKESSSQPDGEIPSRIIKKCKHSISQPIYLLWKESYEKGIVPDSLKQQLIVPIHKKDSKVHAKNYRPISLTSHIVKIFERLIRDQLAQYFDVNCLLSSNQHGFRHGFSCLSQLLAHFEEILSNYLEGSESDVIYLDYAKAFDKVDHNLLLKKLRGYGVCGKTLKWIADFLSGRRQKVIINGFASFWVAVLSGVIQGSVLGPILFIIFINDLQYYVKYSSLRCFADDSRPLCQTKVNRRISKRHLF